MSCWWRLSVMAVVAVPVAGVAAGFDANVSFARRVELGSPVSGVVKSVNAEPGMRVPRGQALVALDDTPFRAGVEQAEAEVAGRSADRDEAQRDRRQAEELYARTVLSTVELDNARLKASRAEAALKEARARLTKARYALAHSVVAAPFDGRVLEVRAEVGQSVVSNLEARALVVLAADAEYLARARVPGATLDALRLGQAVTVSVAGKSWPGRIQSLGLEPAAGDGLYEVAVAFRAPDTVLRAGVAARVDYP